MGWEAPRSRTLGRLTAWASSRGATSPLRAQFCGCQRTPRGSCQSHRAFYGLSEDTLEPTTVFFKLPALSEDPSEMRAAHVGARHGEPAAPLLGLGATRRCWQRPGRRKSAAVIGHVGKSSKCLPFSPRAALAALSDLGHVVAGEGEAPAGEVFPPFALVGSFLLLAFFLSFSCFPA